MFRVFYSSLGLSTLRQHGLDASHTSIYDGCPTDVHDSVFHGLRPLTSDHRARDSNGVQLSIAARIW